MGSVNRPRVRGVEREGCAFGKNKKNCPLGRAHIVSRLCPEDRLSPEARRKKESCRSEHRGQDINKVGRKKNRVTT